MISTTRSYCSCDIPDDRSGQALGEVFGVIDMRAFKEKYRQAVSGSGKEYRRIATLLSSSLCALLHFYNVTDDNPLTLQFTVGINDTQMSVTCTDSIFEYKSPVTAGPSNMDIVLSGKDDRTGKDTLVFAESLSSYFPLLSSPLHSMINLTELSLFLNKLLLVPVICSSVNPENLDNLFISIGPVKISG